MEWRGSCLLVPPGWGMLIRADLQGAFQSHRQGFQSHATSKLGDLGPVV